MATPQLLMLSTGAQSPAQRTPLTKSPVTIGRDPGADVVLSDASASRRHLELTLADGTWYAARLQGAGQVLVNGKALDKTSLRAGDQLVLGGTVLRFEVPGEPFQGSARAPGAAPRPLPRLAVDYDGVHFDVPLREPALTLGRAPDCGIVVPSPLVSGHHARLDREPDGSYALVDTNSTNGLQVNGQRVQRVALQPGMRIFIGAQGGGQDGQGVTLTYDWPVATGVVAGAGAAQAAAPAGGEAATVHARPTGAPQPMVAPPPAPPAAAPQPAPYPNQPMQPMQPAQPPHAYPQPAQPMQPQPQPQYFPMAGHNLTVRAPQGTSSPRPASQPRQPVRTVPISAPAGGMMALIGRDPQATFCLSDPLVSWHHARVYRDGGGNVVLEDLGSTNGTYVNQRRLQRPEPLHKGARVLIGSFAFAFDGTTLNPVSSSGGTRVDVVDLVRTVNKGQQTLLDHVTLPILPGEFVAITGGSGAGKTTLMQAIAGIAPAQRGSVAYDGVDMRTHYDSLRGSIGYVPQTNILHATLTVERALYYSAKLRLAADIPDSEIDRRIGDTLGAVNLGHRRQTIVGKLSGGEKRRLSIASEMLAEPPIIFMDEPAAGLDVLLQKGVRDNIRALTARGLTIVLVTHEPKDIEAADKVAVMGRGGRLCYYGAPSGAYPFFGVTSFEDMLAAVNDEGQADYWRRRFEASPLYQQNVRGQVQLPAQPVYPMGIPAPAAGPQESTAARLQAVVKEMTDFQKLRQKTTWQPWLQQGKLLVRRGVEVLRNDRANLAILLLQAPVLGALLYMLAENSAFVSDHVAGRTLLLLLSVMAIFFGTNNTIRDISKEGDIYQRERLAGLGVVPYLLAKVAIYSVLLAAQTLVLLLIVLAKTGAPPAGAAALVGSAVELYIGTLLAGLAGMAMGLCVSAFANNSDKAVAILPLVVLPQILLAGVVFQLTGPAQALADLTISRWSVQATGASVDLDHDFYKQKLGAYAQHIGRPIDQVAAYVQSSSCADPQIAQANTDSIFDPTDYDAQACASNYDVTSDDPTAYANDGASVGGRRVRVLESWGVLLLFTLLFLGAAGVRQRLKDPT